MFDFLKNSLRELKHVVWPTRVETKKYFVVVMTVLVSFGLYLFLASTLFSELIFALTDFFNDKATTPNFPPIENTITIGSGSIDNSINVTSTGSITSTGEVNE